ncbi:MAG: hypothetical protein P1P90_05015 [Patescibacteria group bacterium]|nr:hypothetical protein [Patescibacteria group bacterium]
MNIEFNKNALQAIGGEIDLLDEEDVASKIKYLFTVLFTPIIIFDLAIFIWPSQLLAVMILFGIVATGLMEFVFGGMGPFAKEIAWNERVSKMHLAFKVLPIAGMVAIALAFGMQTVTGRNIQVELENFWYGLSYIPAPPWWISLGLALFAFIANRLLKRSFVVANEFVKGEDAKSPIISSPKSILGRYLGSWPAFALWIVSLSLACFFFFTAFYSQIGNGAYRFSPDPHQNALALRAITVNGRALPPLQDEVWHVEAVHPHKNGKVRVEFDTPEPVTGSVEFYMPRPKLNDEENVVIELSSLPNPSSKTGLYHNFADFSVLETFSGEYRIVMDTPHVVKNVRVNGEAARATAQILWQTPAPDKTGRVTAQFWTKEKAYGVVEFMPTRAAIKSGIYFPVSVQTTPVEREGKIVAYQHNVDFEVPESFSGKYRLLMRNADRSPQVNHNYGKVIRTAEFDRTLPEPLSRWDRFCAWWHDLWTWDSDSKPRPQRTVVVHQYAPRPSTAPRGTGCKVKPLKVPPSLRDEVAAARRR